VFWRPCRCSKFFQNMQSWPRLSRSNGLPRPGRYFPSCTALRRAVAFDIAGVRDTTAPAPRFKSATFRPACSLSTSPPLFARCAPRVDTAKLRRGHFVRPRRARSPSSSMADPTNISGRAYRQPPRARAEPGCVHHPRPR
jgi:hypothetical protein